MSKVLGRILPVFLAVRSTARKTPHRKGLFFLKKRLKLTLFSFKGEAMSTLMPASSSQLPVTFPSHRSANPCTLKDLMDKVDRVARIRLTLLVVTITTAVAAACLAVAALPLAACAAAIGALAGLIARYFIREVRPYLIVSIDGGGIRGLIPGELLNLIEEQTGVKTAELFHCLAGTSTGGILALGLTKPDPKNPTKPQYTAKEVRDVYLLRGGEIFARSLEWGLSTLGGLVGPKYNVETGLRPVLEEKFQKTSLQAATADCCIVCFDAIKHKPVLFKHDTNCPEKSPDISIVDLALSTGAAPTFFASHPIQGKNLIDGGMAANNPEALVYFEMKERPDLRDRDLFILSLGTGSYPEAPGPSEKPLDGGIVQCLENGEIIDSLFDSQDWTAGYLLKKLAKEGRVYHQRLQVQLSLPSETPMDNASSPNTEALLADTKRSFLHWIQHEDLREKLIEPLQRIGAER